MRVFAISDLHLSFAADKPMDLFGEAWRDHVERLSAAWRETVREDDLVLIPGDISWSIRLQDAAADLAFVGGLPGQKLLLRGNHDYWWSSLVQVRRALPPSVRALQNDALTVGAFAIGGTRGWTLPAQADAQAGARESDDARLYRRELLRLSLSLSKLEAGKRRIAMLHYPPLDSQHRDTEVTALLEQAGVEVAVYGHLHGPAHRGAFNGVHNGIRYALVAADYLQFRPLLIAEG